MGANSKFSKLLLLCVAVLALSANGYAGTISLTNPGFDADVTSNFLTSTLTGWSPNTTEYGIWNTTSTGGVAPAPVSLNNVLFLSAVPGPLDGSASQTAAVATMPGGTYTFTIWAAKRTDIAPVKFELQLYDSNISSAFAVQDYTASSLSSGWSSFTVTGTAPGNASGNIGVRITLASSGAAALPATVDPNLNKFQVLFENAALEGPDGTVDPRSVGTPEPMTMSLIGGGLAGLAFLRRRK